MTPPPAHQAALKRYTAFRIIGNSCAVLSFIGTCYAALLMYATLDDMSKSLKDIIVVSIISLALFVTACILGPKRAKLRPIYERYNG